MHSLYQKQLGDRLKVEGNLSGTATIMLDLMAWRAQVLSNVFVCDKRFMTRGLTFLPDDLFTNEMLSTYNTTLKNE